MPAWLYGNESVRVFGVLLSRCTSLPGVFIANRFGHPIQERPKQVPVGKGRRNVFCDATVRVMKENV